jgi:hypothetical protein
MRKAENAGGWMKRLPRRREIDLRRLKSQTPFVLNRPRQPASPVPRPVQKIRINSSTLAC